MPILPYDCFLRIRRLPDSNRANTALKGLRVWPLLQGAYLLFSLLYHIFTNLSRGVNMYKLQEKDSNLRPPGYEPGKLPLLHPAIRWPLSKVANLWIYMIKIKTIQPVTWWLFRKRRFFISYFAKISVRLIIESMRQQPFTVSKLWIVYV